MAKGDTVGANYTATTTYTPAAGVEVVVTMLGATGASDSWDKIQAAVGCNLKAASQSAELGAKIFLNENMGLRYTKTTLESGYSGVQVK